MQQRQGATGDPPELAGRPGHRPIFHEGVFPARTSVSRQGLPVGDTQGKRILDVGEEP